MNIVVSKNEFANAFMEKQKKDRVAKARKEQEIFIEYRKSKTQRLKRFER